MQSPLARLLLLYTSGIQARNLEDLKLTSVIALRTLRRILVLDVPTMMIELQLKRQCTIFTLDSAIKTDASNSSIILQTFNITSTPSIMTANLIL
jgi:hypothetical protein